jgi:hypothetical protein
MCFRPAVCNEVPGSRVIRCASCADGTADHERLLSKFNLVGWRESAPSKALDFSDKDTSSNWRNPPRPMEKSTEQKTV